LIERTAGKRPKRGPQTRAGDVELTADIRLSVIEDRFVCSACGKRGAEVRPDFSWDKRPVGAMGILDDYCQNNSHPNEASVQTL
jgi:hypothetical protein